MVYSVWVRIFVLQLRIIVRCILGLSRASQPNNGSLNGGDCYICTCTWMQYAENIHEYQFRKRKILRRCTRKNAESRHVCIHK